MFKSMALNRVLGGVQRWENAMKKRSVKRSGKFVWDALIYNKCTDPLVQASS
jgi:hypothetical protein